MNAEVANGLQSSGLSEAEQLERFAKHGDEEAFRSLVNAYFNLVYSTAVRQLNGDTHLAEDVAQGVFADLARKAAILPRRTVLVGWLYEASRRAAAKAARTEQRRRMREIDPALLGRYRGRLQIQYGVHCLDWWAWPKNYSRITDSNTVVAWTGSNPPAERHDAKLRLFDTMFANPEPEKEIKTIDYVSAMADSAPFMVGLTVEK